MSAPYLFSRAIDPLFAMGIGITAAGVRINREEKEKGRSAQESWQGLKRRWAIVMEKQGADGEATAIGGASVQGKGGKEG